MKTASIEPLTVQQIILLLNIHRGCKPAEWQTNDDLDQLVEQRGFVVLAADGYEPTEHGRVLIEVIRAATTADYVG